MAVKYRCPCCRKVSSEPHDLARHFLGQTDKKHKDWLKTQGLSYAQLITIRAMIPYQKCLRNRHPKLNKY
jgi:hypothetical protein